MIKVEASFDDGSVYDVRIMKLFEKSPIPVTFYIPVNYQKYLAKKGIEALPPELIDVIADHPTWEIGSHGVDHELLTRVSNQTEHNEIHGSKAYWEGRGIPVTKFCYPRGYYTQDTIKMVKAAGYESARTVRVGELTLPANPFETHTTVHVGLDRKEYGDQWLTYATLKMQEAIERNSSGEDIVYHFWGHSEEINRLDQWANFEVFLRMIHENLVS